MHALEERDGQKEGALTRRAGLGGGGESFTVSRMKEKKKSLRKIQKNRKRICVGRDLRSPKKGCVPTS